MTRSVTSTDEKNAFFINPTLLLTRLAAIAEREENMRQFFNFKLTHQSESSIKKQLMRKPDKAPLRNVLLTEKATMHPKQAKVKYVLNICELMYHVRWWKGMKFKEFQKHI